MVRRIVPVALIASLGGCAAPAIPSCSPGFGTQVAIFTLFMGKAIPGRKDLTNKEWQAFVTSVVTANLPDGYTVFDANGGWMDPVSHKTIREGTKVLLVALPERPESLAAIDRIRTAYQTQFRQQLVGMTVEHACGMF